ncbi:glycosyltransferase family 4 protein [Leptothoe sp. ISB3NOV94-8A]
MMNVLQIGKGWFPEESGGLNRYFYDCVQYLPNLNLNLQSLVAGSGQTSQKSDQQVYFFSPSKPSLLHRWWMLRNSFKQLHQLNDYNLVSTHFALYTFPILNLLKQPLVVHFHGPWATEGQAEGNNKIAVYFKRYIETTVYKQAKHFIVLSKAFKQVLESSYGISGDKISVVPGGVDLQHFNCLVPQENARQKLNLPCDRPIIFTVRRLAKRMGLEQLVKAISIVRSKHPEVLLLIAGKGIQAKQLQTQIDELGLNQHIKLLGYVGDAELPLYYQAAEFSIIPSQCLEGFGLTLLESLASGTPALGTPVGGIPEVLRPLSSDLVLSGNQVSDLAQGIKEVLQGTRKLPNTIECRQYVEQNHSWPVIAQQLKTIYQSVK